MSEFFESELQGANKSAKRSGAYFFVSAVLFIISASKNDFGWAAFFLCIMLMAALNISGATNRIAIITYLSEMKADFEK